MAAFFLIVYSLFSLQNSLICIIFKLKLNIDVKKKAAIRCFSFSEILFYLMFSFKEDSKAQRGPFEGEKNIKAWGVHNAKTKNVFSSNVPPTYISPPTPLHDLWHQLLVS